MDGLPAMRGRDSDGPSRPPQDGVASITEL